MSYDDFSVRGYLWVVYNLFVCAVALAWRRVLFRTTLIAITGSVGKTSAKECLAAILSKRFPTVNTVGSSAGRRGLPRTLLRARPRHRFIVAEVAILKRGVMWRSALLLRPDIVVMLTIDWQHSLNFRSLDAIAAEKVKLLRGLPGDGLVMLYGDDRRVVAMADPERYRVSTFGTSAKHEVWAGQVTAKWPERLEFQVHVENQSWRVRTRFVGTHWVPSVLSAIATARKCGVGVEQSILTLESVEPFTARLEPVRLPQGAIMLRDEHNGSMATLLVALRVLTEATARRRVAVIGNISDARETYPELCERLGKEVAGAADALVFVGEHSRHCCEAAKAAGAAPANVHHFQSPRAAAEFLRRELGDGDLVLLKAVYDDHLSRIYFDQLGTVGCWKTDCRKSMLCDECPELGFKQLTTISQVTPG